MGILLILCQLTQSKFTYAFVSTKKPVSETEQIRYNLAPEELPKEKDYYLRISGEIASQIKANPHLIDHAYEQLKTDAPETVALTARLGSLYGINKPILPTDEPIPEDAIFIPPPDDHLPDVAVKFQPEDEGAIQRALESFRTNQNLLTKEVHVVKDGDFVFTRVIKEVGFIHPRNIVFTQIYSAETNTTYLLIPEGRYSLKHRLIKEMIAEQHAHGDYRHHALFRSKGRDVVTLEHDSNYQIKSQHYFEKPKTWAGRVKAFLAAIAKRPRASDVASATVCTLGQVATTVCFGVANAFFADPHLWGKIIEAGSWFSAFKVVMGKGAVYPNALILGRAAFPFLIGTFIQSYSKIAYENGRRFKFWTSNFVGGTRLFISLCAIYGIEELDSSILGLALWVFSLNIAVNSIQTAWDESMRYAKAHGKADAPLRIFTSSKNVKGEYAYHAGKENAYTNIVGDFWKSFAVLFSPKGLLRAVEASHGPMASATLKGFINLFLTIPGNIMGHRYAAQELKKLGAPSDEIQYHEDAIKRWRSWKGIKDITKESLEHIFGVEGAERIKSTKNKVTGTVQQTCQSALSSF